MCVGLLLIQMSLLNANLKAHKGYVLDRSIQWESAWSLLDRGNNGQTCVQYFIERTSLAISKGCGYTTAIVSYAGLGNLLHC